MKDGNPAGALEKKGTLRNIESGTNHPTTTLRTEIIITTIVATGGQQMETTRIGTTATLSRENVTTTRARVVEETLTPDVKRHGTQKKIIVPLTK
jgi:hypothetical protein